MRLLDLLNFFLLAPTAHRAVADVARVANTSVHDNPTVDSSPEPVPTLNTLTRNDIDILVVTSPGVSTSTTGHGCNPQDNTDYDCITFSHDHTSTITLTREPTTTTATSEPDADNIDTAHPPTNSNTIIHNLNRKDIDLSPRGNPNPLFDPLPSLAPNTFPTFRWMRAIAEKLESENKWLNHKRHDTVGQFFPFTKEKTAAGVKGLFGCTSVIIVSKKGVYLSHIYEDPVFVQRPEGAGKNDDVDDVPTSDEFFQQASFGALVNGVEKADAVEPIKDLIGSTNSPGPLHHSYTPKIFVVHPFDQGNSGPLAYPERAQWLADQFQTYLYPPGSSPDGSQPQPPNIIAYKAPGRKFAEMSHSVEGKAIVEFSPINHYIKVQGSDEPRAVARWRLFANVREVAGWEFEVGDEDVPVCEAITTAACEGVTTTEGIVARQTTAAMYPMVKAVEWRGGRDLKL
ncbi:hypothetical protein BJY04DRAFT_217626 [Aspergillus karnatakaensis]|uniref:uncharacterized protein n=1 Tax=Aspergillus karnatakaensis TaxID=1810916 RepID=UPI003CCD23FB